MSVPRTKCISTKVTDAEYAAVARVASHQTLSVWVRGALLSAVAIGAYRYATIWTPLQRWYVSPYLRSQVMGSLGFTTTGHYCLLQVLDRTGSRLALDDEVRPVTTATGETAFAFTEVAV